MPLRVPRGFRLSGVHCGLKRDTRKPDLALVASDVHAVAAGVYTQNLVYAAPVALDRSRTPSDRIRVVVANSGNANACTGLRGLEDAREMAKQAALACGAQPDEALVLSTGIIGAFMPIEKVSAGIRSAASRLGDDETSVVAAARGMLTTDTIHKIACRTDNIGGRDVCVLGLAKGAAMMGPNMATMLALIITDAPVTKEAAQATLRASVDETFNCISVDGHMSTNDTVLLVANGQAGGEPLAGSELASFGRLVTGVCEDLARMIPADGEGATHLITIEIEGAADRKSALELAKTVANSPLVKTAVHGADPNWGRIVSAAGYAGVPFDPAGVTLHVNDYLLYQGGTPANFEANVVSKSIREHHETRVRLQFSEGTTRVRFWTTDLSAEYVRLNADYHT